MLVQNSTRYLHRVKRASVLLKLDITKAFDSVQWPFLFDVLLHRGFGSRLLDWMGDLLGTATTKILINGVPGDPIQHLGGLKQGDPCPPCCSSSSWTFSTPCSLPLLRPAFSLNAVCAIALLSSRTTSRFLSRLRKGTLLLARLFFTTSARRPDLRSTSSNRLPTLLDPPRRSPSLPERWFPLLLPWTASPYPQALGFTA